ncbi:MAG: threonine--tRNA ligase [Candidatus Falkowbacteria bacterium]
MNQENQENPEIMRHSISHVLAAAVRELWPDAKFAIGPAIENGFYYDIDFGGVKIGEDDLVNIEKKMKHLIKQNLKFERSEMDIEEALALERKAGHEYKAELIEDLKKEPAFAKATAGKGEKKVSYYKLGNFSDLCRGPHVENTNKLAKAGFKLTKLAGAYWRGDEKNKMLTRIYGVCFDNKEKLEEYLKMIAEASKRDHRKLGKELGLFVFSDLVGPGLPLYTAKGATIRREIIKYSNELQGSIGYEEVHTPNMNKADLFKVSGHYEKYKEDMFRVVSNYSDEEYFLKPMNCPCIPRSTPPGCAATRICLCGSPISLIYTAMKGRANSPA